LPNIFIILQLNNGAVDEEVHFEHAQVIRCDISPRLVERSTNIENVIISEKIQRNIALDIFHISLYFLQ
jgi:hypothetical protein